MKARNVGGGSFMKALLAVIVVGRVAIVDGGVAHAEPPSVKPSDAIATIDAALAKPDATAKLGASMQVAWVDKVAPADLPATEKAWRAQIATAKLTIVYEEIASNSITFVVEATNKARGIVGATTWGAQIWKMDRPALTAKLRGTCVTPPVVTHEVYVNSSAIDQMGEFHQSQKERSVSTARTIDVDGDLVPDVMVPVAPSKHACTEQVSYRIYAMRGACGHDLGIVGPGTIAFQTIGIAPDASGFKPLTLEERVSTRDRKDPMIPVLADTKREFAFANGAYAKTSETKSEGRCHHCAVWTCRAKK